MSSKIWVSILIFLLVLGGSYFFYLQHHPEPEPVKIYRVTVPDSREIVRATVPSRSANEAALDSRTVAPELEAVSGLESVEMQFASIAPVDTELIGEETVNLGVVGDEISKPSSDNEEMSIEEVADWIVEQFEKLNTEFEQNYPDIARLANLTLGEINELYPTDEAKAELGRRSLQAQDEFLSEFCALFSVFPPDILAELLYNIEQEFTEIWGAEFTNLIIGEVRETMGL